MANLACGTGCAMINITINDQGTTNTTSQTNIKGYTFTITDTPFDFSQGGGISIIVDDTGCVQALSKIILEREVVPAMSMIKRAYDALSGINQAANCNADPQNTTIVQMFRAGDLCKHSIDKVEHC